MSPRPSIRARLSRAILAWSATWGVAVAAVIILAVPHEVDELLDDTLQSSAEILAVLLAPPHRALLADVSHAPDAAPRERRSSLFPEDRFAWQLVGADGVVRLRSPLAPSTPLRAAATVGFSDSPEWRVYGVVLPDDGSTLYVAQTMAERSEAAFEAGSSAAVAALGVGLLGHLWLRTRVRRELAPLEKLSHRLRTHDPTVVGASLGEAEREELAPLQAAIDGLGRRLADRLASERAFAAHAAHALRTPLAGIDAQLAIAVLESPAQVRPRIQRAREAAARLHRVVSALLTLFRSSAEIRRESLDLRVLIAKLPVEGLQVQVNGSGWIEADADLLAAALLNLMDNALRYGARQVRIEVIAPDTVRVHDDGPGVDASRRVQLQAAIDETIEGTTTGLGLRLAELIARAHGGRVHLPEVPSGFAVDLILGPSDQLERSAGAGHI